MLKWIKVLHNELEYGHEGEYNYVVWPDGQVFAWNVYCNETHNNLQGSCMVTKENAKIHIERLIREWQL